MTDWTLGYSIHFSSIHLKTWIEHYNVSVKILLCLKRVSRWVGIVMFSMVMRHKTVLIIWGNNWRFREI